MLSQPIDELRAALDAIPADEPRNYLRQSLQLLLPLLGQIQHRLETLELRLEDLEASRRSKVRGRPGNHRPPRLPRT
jgi:hypothetical protein